jgi:hypothetical protein
MGKVQHAAHLHKGEICLCVSPAAVAAERYVARNEVQVLTKQPVVDIILAFVRLLCFCLFHTTTAQRPSP